MRVLLLFSLCLQSFEDSFLLPGYALLHEIMKENSSPHEINNMAAKASGTLASFDDDNVR